MDQVEVKEETSDAGPDEGGTTWVICTFAAGLNIY